MGTGRVPAYGCSPRGGLVAWRHDPSLVCNVVSVPGAQDIERFLGRLREARDFFREAEGRRVIGALACLNLDPTLLTAGEPSGLDRGAPSTAPRISPPSGRRGASLRKRTETRALRQGRARLPTQEEGGGVRMGGDMEGADQAGAEDPGRRSHSSSDRQRTQAEHGDSTRQPLRTILPRPPGRRHGEWAARVPHLDSHAADAAAVIATGPSVSLVQCRLPMMKALSIGERALPGEPTQCHNPI